MLHDRHIVIYVLDIGRLWFKTLRQKETEVVTNLKTLIELPSFLCSSTLLLPKLGGAGGNAERLMARDKRGRKQNYVTKTNMPEDISTSTAKTGSTVGKNFTIQYRNSQRKTTSFLVKLQL